MCLLQYILDTQNYFILIGGNKKHYLFKKSGIQSASGLDAWCCGYLHVECHKLMKASYGLYMYNFLKVCCCVVC